MTSRRRPVYNEEMGRQAIVVVYVPAMIVLIFGALYLRFVKGS